MAGKGVPHQHISAGAGVEKTLVGGLEEALVGVEARLQQLVQELPEDAPAVNPGLVQTMSVE